MKEKEKQLEKKVGAFVLIGLILTMASIIILGGKQSIFASVIHYTSHFAKIDGLVPGAKVTLGGLQIGSVSDIMFDPNTRDMKVDYAVEKKFADFIRKDSTVEIVTQGVLGDKYLSVIAGDPSQPMVEDRGQIPEGARQDLSQILTSSEKLVSKLTSTADNLDRILTAFNKGNRADQIFEGLAVTSKSLGSVTDSLSKELNQVKIKSAIGHLNSILEKVDQGQGSLGALINDPALYDDAKALVGQTNRNRIMRNIIRQTIKDKNQESQQ